MRIAIIGFGFSGLMAAVNLIRHATGVLTLYIIDEHPDGRGTAYSTTNPDHLLNVVAGGMSVFADMPDHLVAWLATPAAAAAKAALNVTRHYTAQDFIPRALYGAYLTSIWQDAQAMAGAKHVAIKQVPTKAVAISNDNGIAVLTERGDAIAVERIVLAVGHEAKVIFPQIKTSRIVQDVWAPQALAGAAGWESPVMLLGTGLTAIDLLLTLRRIGYEGDILMASYRGLLPQKHAPQASIFRFSAEEVAAQKTLAGMMRLLRSKVARHGDWRAVFDALRPSTQGMWQRLTTREQRRFLARVMPQFGVHRHRMAPEIAAVVERELATAKTRIIASRHINVMVHEQNLQVTANHETFRPSHLLNCAGLELNLASSNNNLLRQLLAEGMVEAHVTGLGVAADPHYRAWGLLHPNLTVIGSLLTGQLLESTAVPELREQAASIRA